MITEAHTGSVPTYPGLVGKVAVVTGGSMGIGASLCRVLAMNKVKVAVVARGRKGVDALVNELRAQNAEAIGISADCTRLSDLNRVRQQVEDDLGPTDILAVFAGGFSSYTPVQDIPEQEWRDVIDWNLTSTFLTVKSFLPGMIDRRQGAIVTMASNSARVLDIPLTASYAAAKGGVIVFTRHVAKEVGQYGVRVNCVAPATTFSDRVERIMSKDKIRDVAAMAPLGRLGMPEDSALAALYLVSESASWVTGITLDVAGGRIML